MSATIGATGTNVPLKVTLLTIGPVWSDVPLGSPQQQALIVGVLEQSWCSAAQTGRTAATNAERLVDPTKATTKLITDSDVRTDFTM